MDSYDRMKALTLSDRLRYPTDSPPSRPLVRICRGCRHEVSILSKRWTGKTPFRRLWLDGANAAARRARANKVARRQAAALVKDAARVWKRTLLDRPAPAGVSAACVSEIVGFGSNPGALRMLVHAHARMPAGRPLVVVLHGCGQDVAAFADASGWVALADELGFALLMPEQVHANNRGGCFNWFRPDDVRRSSGEAMSIRQMLRVAIARYACDPRRIFIVGFSAGGGMAAAMLAAYPAVFAAGGNIAGMPVGCAQTQVAAMLHMRRANISRSPATSVR